MKNLVIALIGVSFFFAGCNSCPEQYNSPDDMVKHALKIVKTITANELHELMNSEEIYTLIDVRQKSEYYYGYIPGSLVIPRGSVLFNIGSEKYWEDTGLYMPLKDETIVVYCKKGSRGILAAESLVKLGYKKVVALDGGFIKWELTYPDETEKDLDMLSGGGEEEHVDTGGC